MTRQTLIQIALVSLFLATTLAMQQRPPRRPSNETGSLPGGGSGLKDKIIGKIMGAKSKRAMESDDEGDISYSDEETGQKVKLGVRRIQELDMHKQPVCGMAKMDFDGKNPDSVNVTRESKPEIDGSIDFAGKFKGNRTNNFVKMMGAMQGKGQRNQLRKGSVTVDFECIMKTDTGSTTVTLFNSSTVVKEGDMKCTVTIQGYQFCGTMGRDCPCANGTKSEGAYLRLFFKVEAGSGKDRLMKPKQSEDSKKLRKDSTSMGEKEIIPFSDPTKKFKPVIRFMNTQLADNGTDLSSDSVDITPDTWREQGGAVVPGVLIDLKRASWDPDTKYIYDPTTSYEAEIDSTNSSDNSGAAHMAVSGFVLCFTALMKYLY